MSGSKWTNSTALDDHLLLDSSIAISSSVISHLFHYYRSYQISITKSDSRTGQHSAKCILIRLERRQKK